MSSVDQEQQQSTETPNLAKQELEGNFVQLIDEDGGFTDKLPAYLQQTGMTNKGIDYSLLSVFGPQSSGKSTLLNGLFGTSFTTMNSTAGRYQVTKGVCVSKAVNHDVLVMDLEGTDSKERGEENMSFEKKISLFALAISEVLLVNMWMQDIGRYNASNYSLLKTVFELNLQLFQKHKTSKTLLLFTIRDHIEEISSLAILKNQIMADIDKIWSSLIQPEEYKSSKVTDFFDFEFTSLPHKVLKEKEFWVAVDDLRDRFTNPNSERGYLFKPNYKKCVPIDGFQIYASNIWSTILSNKDLDIPTQKEMLAMYRCGEISNEVYVQFEQFVNSWDENIRKKKIVTRLGEVAQQAAEKVLDAFTQQTLLYTPSVVELKREELLDRMKQAVYDVFRSQLLLIRENAVMAFKKLLGQVVSKRDTVLLDFNATVAKIKEEVLNFFESKADEAIYPGEQWDHDVYKQQLIDEVDRHISDERTHQIRVLIDNEKALLADNMKNGLGEIMKAPGKDFWKSLRKFRIQKIDEVKFHLEEQLQGFGASEHETGEILEVLKGHAKVVQQGYIENYVNQLTLRMNNRYDEIFKFNGQVARTWKSVDEIQKVHNMAAMEALNLLDIFFLMRLDHPEYDNIHLHIPSQDAVDTEFKFPDMSQVVHIVQKYRMANDYYVNRTGKKKSDDTEDVDDADDDEELSIQEEFMSNLLLDKNTCSRMHTDFVVRIHSSLQSAQDRFVMLSNNKSIPWWMFLVLLILGWDEMMYFLKSPFWLLTFLIVGGFFGWGYLRNQIQNYLEHGNNEMVKIALRIVLEKVDGLTQSALGQQIQQQLAVQQQQQTVVAHHQPSTPTANISREAVSFPDHDTSPVSPVATKSIVEDGIVGDTDSVRRRIAGNKSRGSVRFASGFDSLKNLQSQLNDELQ